MNFKQISAPVPYLPKPLSKATISCLVSWKAEEGLFSERLWISFSENRIFRAVPRPWVYTHTHTFIC